MTTTPESTMTKPASDSLATFDSLPNAAHVRLPVVSTLYGVGPASIWRWVKAGRLPKPVKVGMQAVAWNVGELRQHLAQCRSTEEPAASGIVQLRRAADLSRL
jgi:predicted DNA-binding transcriptional regulator AlpA